MVTNFIGISDPDSSFQTGSGSYPLETQALILLKPDPRYFPKLAPDPIPDQEDPDPIPAQQDPDAIPAQEDPDPIPGQEDRQPGTG